MVMPVAVLIVQLLCIVVLQAAVWHFRNRAMNAEAEVERLRSGIREHAMRDATGPGESPKRRTMWG